MVIITTGNLAESLETTLKMCDNINEQFSAHLDPYLDLCYVHRPVLKWCCRTFG